MKHCITLIEGDGIGPEVTDAVVRLLDRSGLEIEWDRENVGAAIAKRSGHPLPKRVLDSIIRNRVALIRARAGLRLDRVFERQCKHSTVT